MATKKRADKPKKETYEPLYPSIRDFPGTMSSYERESLAAEARLAAERKLKKRLGAIKPMPR
jgi:hypothetical protein